MNASSKIFWAYGEKSTKNYKKIQRNSNSPGGIITVELNRPLSSVYDRLRIAKGPSCGTEFTLVGPYFYLAHYNLVSHQVGRDFLKEQGINPEALRISVGTENVEDIIYAFSEVL